jgi:hypothetical protein
LRFARIPSHLSRFAQALPLSPASARAFDARLRSLRIAATCLLDGQPVVDGHDELLDKLEVVLAKAVDVPDGLGGGPVRDGHDLRRGLC